MKISELAQAAQCTVGTVRYYEKEGLLSAPERTAVNYRVYGAAHLERLRFIRSCRSLDMSHNEIRTLLRMMDSPSEACGGVNDLLDEHITHVEVRINELIQLKSQLATLRTFCQIERSVDKCGILHGLTAMGTDAKPLKHTHLG